MSDINILYDVEIDEISVVNGGMNNKKRFPVTKSVEGDSVTKAFRSEAQRAYMYAQVAAGDIEQSVVDEFEAATPKNKKLPKRVPKDDEENIGKSSENEGLLDVVDGTNTNPNLNKNLNERGDPPIKERIMDEKLVNEKIEAVEKSANEKIEAVQKASAEALETLKKAHDVEKNAQDKVIQDMKDADALKTWVSKSVTELSHVPGKNAAELGKMLFDLEKTSPEIAKTTFETLKATSDSLKASDMLKAVGSNASGMSGSALDKINVLKDGVVSKSDGKISDAKAFVQVVTQHPELYREYLNEHPKQTGN